MTNNQQHQQINNNRDIIAIHPLLDAMGSCFSVRSRDNVIRLSGTSIDSLRSSLLDPNAKNMQMQGQAVNDSSSDKQGNEALETYQSPMLNEIATGAGSEGNPRPLPGVGNDKRRNSTNRSAIANVTNPLTNASSLIRCEYAAKPKADWFVKRGQFIKSWKRRYFVLDGWEMRYYEDAQKSVEKGKISLRGASCRYVDDSHSSGGANIVISSISFVEGATSGVGGAGGRELVVECDSSYKAENWMDALMDVLVIENTRILRLLFPDAPQPVPETLIYPNPYINQSNSGTNHTISPSDLAELIKWCRECVFWYEDAIDVLETSFVGVMAGVNANGEPTSERCVLSVSPDRKSVLWRALRPEEGDPPALDKRDRPRPSGKDSQAEASNKSSLNAKSVVDYLNSPAVDMVLDSDPSDLKGQFFSIPFSSIRDICLGSLRAGANAANDEVRNMPAFSRTKSNNSTDSAGFGRDSQVDSYYPSSELYLNNFDTVLSIVTPSHSLEVELDEQPISESSMWIEFLGNGDAMASSSPMRRSSLGRLTTGSDEKMSISAAFTNSSGAASKVTPQQLAACPRIMRRHPFIRSLRTVLLLRPYIPMFEHIIRTTSINTTVMNKQNAKGAKSRPNEKSGPKKAQLRPVQRIWEKTGQLVQAN